MSTGYQIEDQTATYFLTFQVIDWVDIFTRPVYRDIILESFDFCRRQKGLRVWAYVIMTNHVHCIFSAQNENLSTLIRDFKRFTSTKIMKTIQAIPESRRDWMVKRFEFAAKRNARAGEHQFWTHENHAEIIYSAPFFLQKLNYIHLNPVRAKFVYRPEDWLYSSARNYLGLDSLIEIDVSEL